MQGDFPGRVILGHNQFFGINHLSNQRGVESAQYFNNMDNIINLIKYAYSKGVSGLMMSTHERAKDIAQALRKEPDLVNNLDIYILLPYMAKYVRKSNETGMVNMIMELMISAGWAKGLSISIKGSKGLVTKDPISMLKTLIDIELLPFQGLNIKTIFLHNTLTDLTVGLKLSKIINFFQDYILDKHKINPGYCTLTSGLTMKYIHDIGIKNPIIMAPFNPVGFQMSPSKKLCEQMLHEIPSRIIAMSVLAAGYVKPEEAANYLFSLPEIKSAIFGASSKRHIDESFGIINKALSR